MTDPFDSEIYGGLFAPPDLTALFTDGHHVQTMLAVEAALARVQAELGVIPADAGDGRRARGLPDDAPVPPRPADSR